MTIFDQHIKHEACRALALDSQKENPLPETTELVSDKGFRAIEAGIAYARNGPVRSFGGKGENDE
jgi:hypothetical protein